MPPAYFIGFTLDSATEKAIIDCQKKYYDPSTMRPPLQPHITLIHPAALFTIARQHYIPSIKPILKKHTPAQITLGDVQMFGKHTVYLSVHSADITSLYESLVRNLPSDLQSRYFIGKSFQPHITILQAQQGQRIDESVATSLKYALRPQKDKELSLHRASVFRQTARRQYVSEPMY